MEHYENQMELGKVDGKEEYLHFWYLIDTTSITIIFYILYGGNYNV